MEISRDALMRVTKAARISQKLAKDVNETFMFDRTGTTWMDIVAGELLDALGDIVGEELGQDQDVLDDSQVYKLLTDPDLDDEVVTAAFVGMYRSKHPEQPKPHFVNRDKMREQAKAGYGYMAPEVKLK